MRVMKVACGTYLTTSCSALGRVEEEEEEAWGQRENLIKQQ